jgi:spore photoproduct lyase
MPKISIKLKKYEMLNGSTKYLVQQVGDGSIIKRFEKTPLPTYPKDVVCPHFLELKWAYGCPYDCSWCYLKGTLRLLPTKTKPVFKNREKIESHIKMFFHATQDGYPAEILNTGELADSLMAENMKQSFSKFIISLFETQNKHRVLFLTKSNNVKNLLSITARKQAIISFSLNAGSATEKWEKGPPPTKARIEAARKVSKVGYETRIRIDPIVPILNWQRHYSNLIDHIFARFIPERITLGSLRGLQSTINEAKDRSWVKYLSEPSGWGKKIEFGSRYQMYSMLIKYMEKKYHYTSVALCKETREMWEKLEMDWTRCKCNCTW